MKALLLYAIIFLGWAFFPAINQQAAGADSIAGVTSIGSPILPNGGVAQAGVASLGADEPISVLVDPQDRFVLVAVRNPRSRIVKIDLTNFPPAQEAELFLELEEFVYTPAAIDPTGTFAYFISTGSFDRIIKVRTSDMTRVATIDLTVADDSIQCAAIDGTGTFGYFGISSAPGKIIKVNLANFQRVATLTLGAGENYTGAIAIDKASQYLYVGTEGFPARVVKINLSNFTRQSAIVLPAGEFSLSVALFDPTETFLYFGTRSNPGAIIKIRLSNFTRVGSIILPANNLSIWSGVMDPTGFFAYFGVSNGTAARAELHKVDLSAFALVNQIVLGNNQNPYPYSGGMQSNGVSAYFGVGGGEAGSLVRVSMAQFSQSDLINFPVGMGPRQAAIDRTGRFAYCCNAPSGTGPQHFAEIDLNKMVRTRTLTLPVSSGFPYILLEPSGNFAYVTSLLALNQPGLLIEIDLKTFTRKRTMQLAFGEEFVSAALMDPYGRYAYLNAYRNGFTTSSLVRVNLATMQRMGTLGFTARISSAQIDPNGQYGYFLRSTNNSLIEKVDLSTLQLTNTLQLLADETPYDSAIDPTGRFLYYGTNGGGKVVKINLSTFQRVGNITLDTPAESSLPSMVVDPSGRGLYITASFTSRRLVKVDTATFTRVGAADLPLREPIIADRQGNYLYSPGVDQFGRNGIHRISLNSRGVVRATKIDLRDAASVNSVSFYSHAAIGSSRKEAQPLQPGMFLPACSIIDGPRNIGYFGIQATPGKVVRYDLNTHLPAGMLTFQDNLESDPTCALIDPAREFAYFGCFSSPGKVVKVRLSDFTQVDTETFGPGEDNIACAAMDAGGQFAYFGCNTDPPRIVKVRLSDFTRIGAALLNSGEGPLRTALISPNGSNAYFGAFTAPGKVTRINLSTFARDGGLTFNSGENQIVSSVRDSNGTFAYFGTAESPGKVIKVQLSNLSRVGAITMNAGEDDLRCAAIAPDNTFALFGSSLGSVLRVNLGTFMRSQATTSFPTDGQPATAFIDGAGQAWFGCGGTPAAKILSLAISPKPLSLALYKYDNDTGDWNRLWQGGPVAVNNANAFLTIPIGSGLPAALALKPGEHFLAWNLDSDVPAASYAPQTDGGLEFSTPLGSFPPFAGSYYPYEVRITNDQWTGYISYQSRTAARNWLLYR